MRNIRKKTKKPRVPWNKTLIKEERKLLNEYGLRRKKEIRSAQAILRNLRQRARVLIANQNEEKEKTLLNKLSKLGFVKGTKDLDNVLALDVKDILDRRLQTIIFKKGIAHTPKQARQLIIHGKVLIDNRKIIFPSYIVLLEEEGKISLHGK
ncbi:MAG: 30S ribosomal protein S4 [Nanoarchaeota archaeon]|nr:30S ribosomal protein S4 [Nanoarchaeota archaeon]MBU1135272.1 30S ribosomal protein S4 [Nanoarchaeota archaeon]MBU2519878.1 30S ribosomal protein S4 [Nanoarchaeota archaeon]